MPFCPSIFVSTEFFSVSLCVCVSHPHPFQSLCYFLFSASLLLLLLTIFFFHSISAEISGLWSERYQSQQWQFNIKRRNHVDAVRRDGRGRRRRWRTTNESPFRRKWITDYDDNEKQSFNCGNGGAKCKYSTQLEHSSNARDPFIFIALVSPFIRFTRSLLIGIALKLLHTLIFARQFCNHRHIRNGKKKIWTVQEPRKKRAANSRTQ